MIWWAEQPNRAQDERAAVADLADRSPWLSNVTSRLAANFALVIDFDMEIGDRSLPLTLVYPDFFPDAAASVIPRDGVRLSGHQYGADGELCLEHRPDNWTPNITGAMMIESAYRLLSSEQETDQAAASDHRTLPAQRTRGTVLRFVISLATWAGLSKVSVGDHAEGELLEHYFGGVYAAQLSRIGPADAPIWNDPNGRGYGALPVAARIVRLPKGTVTKCKSLDELTKLLRDNGFGELASELVEGTVCTGVILFDGNDVGMPMVLGAGATRKVINYDLVVAEETGTRLDPEYSHLKAAKVAVVGCGSVGSKVAVQLARSGVSRFVLVDGDVLAAGNLVRNELDWRAVGMHKSQAVAARLKEIRTDCEVISRTTVMGGQESGDTLSSTIRLIEKCDFIIDATADPSAFNLCAAIARRAKKPICWAQVFGGGAGGVVVRLRPEIDPTPLTARQRLESYYAEQGVDWPDDGSSQPYAVTSGPGTPLIADDADVSVIAAHLSRFAVDLIARPNASIFPYSAYLVGMRERWLFTAPFDVRPIDLGPSDTWGTEHQSGDTEALKRLLADLMTGTPDAG